MSVRLLSSQPFSWAICSWLQTLWLICSFSASVMSISMPPSASQICVKPVKLTITYFSMFMPSSSLMVFIVISGPPK